MDKRLEAISLPTANRSWIASNLRHTSPIFGGNLFRVLGSGNLRQRLAGEFGEDFATLMREVDFLMGKRFPLGVALVVGEMKESVCRQLKKNLLRQADYISWFVAGPVLIAAFREGLFDELHQAWRLVTTDNANIATGVAFSRGLHGANELLSAAHTALHRALLQNKRLLVLDQAEATAAVASQKIATTMKQHLASGGGSFDAYFQPQVEIGSGKPVGAEAMARWAPDDIAIPPAQFIPIAEEYGLIGEIGQLMFARAAHTLRSLRDSGYEVPRMAINVSAAQCRADDFLRTAIEILRDEDLAPTDIELEISESMVGAGSWEFLGSLAEIAAAGFHIAIDEFGTGSSSLARIREISAGKIKLDRAFVTRLPDDQTACTMCRMALDLVHGLGKTSLAYGIERPEQAIYLGALGCAYGQGYYWASPMSESDLIDWWGQGRTTH
ncbi:MAG: EAL domain-containing protein [Rhodocyclales bacterium]|nr:EAL domain-containing protein [Rhodocyclales bacterium]